MELDPEKLKKRIKDVIHHPSLYFFNFDKSSFYIFKEDYFIEYDLVVKMILLKRKMKNWGTSEIIGIAPYMGTFSKREKKLLKSYMAVCEL